MNEPTEEQVKSFWEYFGFKFLSAGEKFPTWWIVNWPDGRQGTCLKTLITPGIDMNRLFEFAAPKLDYFEIKYASKAPFTSVKILHENKEYYGKHKEPALALFWAIWQIIP
jgi:hypothetical protein